MHSTNRTATPRSRRWQSGRERGYDYVAITDHSATHGFGNDVPPDELLRQSEHIASLELDGIQVLAGTETTSSRTGRGLRRRRAGARRLVSRVSYVLPPLREKQTDRMVAALHHRWWTRSGTPRPLIERREAYARGPGPWDRRSPGHRTFLEINATRIGATSTTCTRGGRDAGVTSLSTPTPTAAHAVTCATGWPPARRPGSPATPCQHSPWRGGWLAQRGRVCRAYCFGSASIFRSPGRSNRLGPPKVDLVEPNPHRRGLRWPRRARLLSHSSATSRHSGGHGRHLRKTSRSPRRANASTTTARSG